MRGARPLLILLPLLGAAIAATEPLHHLEELTGLRWLFAWRGPVAPPRDVVIVRIDSRSATELGLPRSVSRWPRSVHACVLERYLSEAAIVTFDINFVGRSAPPGVDVGDARLRDACSAYLDTPDPDATLAAAMRGYGRIFLVQPYGEPNGPHVAPLEPVCVGFDTTPVRLDEMPIDAKPKILTPLNAALSHASLAWAPFGLPTFRRGASWYWTSLVEAGNLPTLPTLLLAYTQAPTLFSNSPNVTPGEIGAVSPRAHALGKVLRAAHQGTPGVASVAVPPALLGGNCRYLNPYGEATKALPSVSYQALIAGSAPAHDFRGKAVFIGFQETSAASRGDQFITPSARDDAPYSGVELLATAYANLRDQRSLQPSRHFIVAGAAIGALLATTALFDSALLFGISAVLTVLGISLASWYAFASALQWMPFVTPLVALSPLAVVANQRRRHQGREDKQQAIIAALEKHVPLQEVRLPTRGAFRTTCGLCVATDARNFTALAGRLGPVELGRLLDDYYDALIPAIVSRGGIVIDTAGDGLLSVFPDLADEFQRTQLALAVGRGLLKAAHGYDLHHPGGELSIRIGIASGNFALGVIGSQTRHFYKAVGLPINTAARLEALAKKLRASCVIEAATLTPDSHRKDTRPLGRHRLRGLTDPMAIVELLTVDSSAAESLE